MSFEASVKATTALGAQSPLTSARVTLIRPLSVVLPSRMTMRFCWYLPLGALHCQLKAVEQDDKAAAATASAVLAPSLVDWPRHARTHSLPALMATRLKAGLAKLCLRTARAEIDNRPEQQVTRPERSGR